MADTFQPVTFVADEILTSTKMNLIAANQAAFHSGEGLGDGIIGPRHLGDTGWLTGQITYASGWSEWSQPSYVRRIGNQVLLQAEFSRTGGAINASSTGNLPDTVMGTLSPDFRAAGGLYSRKLLDAAIIGYWPMVADVADDGVIMLAGSANSNASVANGDHIQVRGSWLID